MVGDRYRAFHPTTDQTVLGWWDVAKLKMTNGLR